MDENKKKRGSGIFGVFYRDKKDSEGVKKGDEFNVLKKPDIKGFFKLLTRRYNNMLTVNMFYIFGNFPVLFALFALAGYTSHTSVAPTSALYTVLKGSSYFDITPVTASLNGVFGIQAEMVIPTAATYVFYALSLLALITFGLVNVGCTYIIRNIIKGEPVFFWSDFWYAIKRNIKQGIIYGIIDLFLCFMLVYDLFWFRANMGVSSTFTFFYFSGFAMIVLHFFVRMYVYPMMITFDLSIFKLIKNGVFFAVLGIKRNLMCLLGTAVIIALNYAAFVVLMPVGIILPFVITISLCSFLSVYCAFPKIKEIMIDPYYKEEKISNTEN